MTETEKPAPDGLVERLLEAIDAFDADVADAWADAEQTGERPDLWPQEVTVPVDLLRQAQSALAELREECCLSMQTIADERTRAETAEAQVQRLTEENEGLRKLTGPDMWCQTCGTVTRDDECGCNRFGEVIAEQRLVNLADELGRIAREEMGKREAAEAERDALRKAVDQWQQDAADLAGEAAKLRKALEQIATDETHTAFGTKPTAGALIARQSLSGIKEK